MVERDWGQYVGKWSDSTKTKVVCTFRVFCLVTITWSQYCVHSMGRMGIRIWPQFLCLGNTILHMFIVHDIQEKKLSNSMSIVTEIPSMLRSTLWQHQKEYVFPTVFNCWVDVTNSVVLPNKLDLADDRRYILSVCKSASLATIRMQRSSHVCCLDQTNSFKLWSFSLHIHCKSLIFHGYYILRFSPWTLFRWNVMWILCSVTLLQYTAKMFAWYFISQKQFICEIREINPSQNLRLLQ